MLKTSLLFCGVMLVATSASSATMELSLIGKVTSYTVASPEVGSRIVYNNAGSINIVDAVKVTENQGKEFRLTFVYDSSKTGKRVRDDGSVATYIIPDALQYSTVWVDGNLVSSSNIAQSEFDDMSISSSAYQGGGSFSISNYAEYFAGNLWSWVGISTTEILGFDASLEAGVYPVFDTNQTILLDDQNGGGLSLFSYQTQSIFPEDAVPQKEFWESTWFSRTDIIFTLSQIVISGAAGGEVDPGDTSPAPVPLPAGGALLAGGLLALAGYRRRK